MAYSTYDGDKKKTFEEMQKDILWIESSRYYYYKYTFHDFSVEKINTENKTPLNIGGKELVKESGTITFTNCKGIKFDAPYAACYGKPDFDKEMAGLQSTDCPAIIFAISSNTEPAAKEEVIKTLDNAIACMDKSEAEAQEFAKTVNRDYMAHAQIKPSYTGTNGTKGAVMQAGNLSVLVPSDWYISGKGYGRYGGENTVGLYSITPHFDYHFVTKDEKGIKTNSEKLLERLKKDPKSEYESIEEFECGGRKWFGYKFKEPLGVTGVYVDAFTVYTVGEGDNSLEVTGLSTAYDTDLSKDMLEAVKVVKEKSKMMMPVIVRHKEERKW